MKLDRIKVDEAKILRVQGYRDLSAVRPVIARAAAKAARETEEVSKPCAYFREVDVNQCCGRTLELADGTVFENEAFQRFLNGTSKVVVFILTMGRDLDESVKDHIANDRLLDALFMEVAGWMGVEVLTRELSTYLRIEARAYNLRLSPRLGPGYSYKLDGRSVLWPLEQQRSLFGLFDGNPMDVELLESCAMLPKISRSGIFGLLPAR